MHLRRRVSAAPEVLQDFELAAEQKYVEGIELATAGHRGAGIYLLGYAAEMKLKISCFRLDGARLSDPVGAMMGPSRRWMAVYCPTIAYEGYHSLLFWMHLLRRKRRMRGRPLPAPIDWELVRRVRRLYGVWWVEMRYRPDQSQAAEVEWVYNDVTWLRDHAVQLWR